MTSYDENTSDMEVEHRPLFGLFVAQVYPWEQMVVYARLAETLGFDSLWVADHFVNPYKPETDWFEGWTLLAGLAAMTKTIRIGTMVTHVVYRNPALLARQAMTVDHISNGRLEIGIGSGGSRHCHEMTGVPNWEPKERTQRFIEGVEIVDCLLRQEVTTYEGRYYRVKEALMHPSPVQRPRPPIIVAAHGPKTLKLAARYGDGWSHYWPGADLTPEEELEVTRGRNEKLTAFAEELGRDPGSIKRSQAAGYASDRPFASIEALHDYVGRYSEIGMNEFILGYTPGFEEFEGRFATKPEQLEQVAAEILVGR